jgi:hypothetical protein
MDIDYYPMMHGDDDDDRWSAAGSDAETKKQAKEENSLMHRYKLFIALSQEGTFCFLFGFI